jgi:hypothetical protein
MSRQRRNRISGQFAAQLVEMLESPAYRALSLSAHRVLDRIQIEFAHHGGTENGRLPVTYDQFCEYGLHRHAIGQPFENWPRWALSKSPSADVTATGNSGRRISFG